MSRLSRILVAAAALILAVPFFAPLWRISLIAPQYPEGMGMRIGISSVKGASEFDLNNINTLNHYIGMKEIVPDSIPELRFMPWILGALIATALLVAALGRRRVLLGWIIGAGAIGVVGLADFWWWGYRYGHELDPNAIIKVPGMTYQPPLIGTKQLLNITASSWPDIGGVALGVGILLAAVAWWISRGANPDKKVRVARKQRPHHRRVQRELAGVAAVLLLVAPAPALAASGTRSKAVRDTVVVSPTGAIRTLAEGVRRARAGATVVVRRGVYREPTVLVDKPLTLIGDSLPFFDGDSVNPILVVGANDVTIRGIGFRNVGFSDTEDRAAIRVVGATGCLIQNNVIENSYFGIYLAEVEQCRVTGNTLRGTRRGEAHSGNGIHLWTSRANLIAGNAIDGHRDGIYLEFSKDNDIRDNHSRQNQRYGLHFMYSDSCRYVSNFFEANAAGVAVMYTKTVEMVGNRFERAWGSSAYGLLLKEVSDARIVRNVFRSNSTGLLADGANRIQADSNTFASNGWAVRILASTDDGRFEANDFIGNTFDVTTNATRLSSRFEGNYWEAYRGYDLDRDGRGDIPHRPMRLFALIVESSPSTIVLLRTPIVALLDVAEMVLPVLTPELLIDARPAIRRNS